MSLQPTSDLVAQYWLRSLTLPADTGVAGILPDPWDTESGPSSWEGRDFLTARTVGGNVDIYVSRRIPVVTIDCWSRPTNQGASPPWNRANSLAETVRLATYEDIRNVTLDLPSPYLNARVWDVSIMSEPRRIQDDPLGLARYTLDVQFVWASEGS